MARRFGRNQKRAMRRRVELLEVARTNAHEARLRAERSRDDLHRQLAQCKAALGERFVGFDPVEAAWRAVPEDDFKVMCAGGEQYMRVMRTTVVSDDIRDQTHFRVTLGGEVAGYCIAESALLGAPARVIAAGIGRELAEHLVGAIRSIQGGRR